MKSPFSANDLILFTGDSITDCDRERNNSGSLGSGFVGVIARQLWMQFEKLDLVFRNTGISGDRTCDLIERWGRDCIDLQPDWVSILIGVNNTWRRYDTGDPTEPAVFEAETRQLLERVRDQTRARTILCSPFLVHTNPGISAMREDLDPKIAVLHTLALEFDAIWVDFNTAFIEAEKKKAPECWAEDGVHPSAVGHCLMAKVWQETVCA
mgnify:CR=1 FL=1